MFEHIAMNRPLGNAWQIEANGVDISQEVVGWQVVPADQASSMPKLWLAVIPAQLIIDSKWIEPEDYRLGRGASS